MKDVILLFILSIFTVIGVGFVIFLLPILLTHDCSKENTNVVIIQKDSTIKQLKVEMNDEIQKALNADDSVAIKQFIELVTK